MLRRKDIARKVVRLLVRKLPKEKGKLIATGEFIGFLAQLYRRDRIFRNYFVSPFIPKEKKLSYLKNLMDKFNVPEDALDVFEYLIDINAFSLLSEMKRLYDHEVERIMKMSKGFLQLAHRIDDEGVKRIIGILEKALGRHLEVEVLYDENLIGGFVFKTSGFVIDTSVKRQLEKLSLHGG